MAAIYIPIIIVAVLIITFTCYACCVVAGRSDERDRKMYEDWLAALNKEKEEEE